MTKATRSLIQEATKRLRILNLILYEAEFKRPNAFPEDLNETTAQHKREVRYGVAEPGEGEKVLQVIVDLGLRLVASPKGTETDDAPLVFIEIEASFAVWYAISDELSAEALEAFTGFNSIHNVWPFWRQHLFDLSSRARLPTFEVPLFAGVEV